jgi:hypothetical protein
LCDCCGTDGGSSARPFSRRGSSHHFSIAKHKLQIAVTIPWLVALTEIVWRRDVRHARHSRLRMARPGGDWRWAVLASGSAYAAGGLRPAARIITTSAKILLESVQACVNVEDVVSALGKIWGGKSVHNVHVWSLSVDSPELSSCS